MKVVNAILASAFLFYLAVCEMQDICKEGCHENLSWQDKVYACAKSGPCHENNCDEFVARKNPECQKICSQQYGLEKQSYGVGQLSPTSLFGRYLLCLAAFAPARMHDANVDQEKDFVAVDAFTGTGDGSPSLLLQGLQQRKSKARLVTFERYADFVGMAERMLAQVAEGDSNIHAYSHETWTDESFIPPWHDNQQHDNQQFLTNSNVSVFIGQGGLQGHEIAILKVLTGVDLVLFDPPEQCDPGGYGDTDHVSEWAYLEMVGPRFVAVHNTAMPFHGGWVVNRLRLKGWTELASGMHQAGDPNEAVDSFKERFFLERGWSILYA